MIGLVILVILVFFSMFWFSRGANGPELVKVETFETRDGAEQLGEILAQNGIDFLLSSAQSSMHGAPEGTTFYGFIQTACKRLLKSYLGSRPSRSNR